MRSDSDERLIEKILDYCITIIEIMEKHEYNYEEFLSNKEFYLAISMAEMQIGEDSKFLSDEIKEFSKNKISWFGIRSMRNMYAHEYKKMKTSDIWKTAVEEIPVIQEFCETYLKENLGEESDDLHN
ncbi:MAG: DUF86 domain-containing protein [Ruminococcus sp.]|jgi:uncharacterized protein with HEPN domain|nr:DUF86 domain-containing protein [Ruminococcus sp.]